MLCAAAYAAAATAIALGIAVALINVILVLSVLGGELLAISSCLRLMRAQGTSWPDAIS